MTAFFSINNHRLLYLCLLVVIGLLHGCSIQPSQPQQPTHSNWNNHQLHIMKMAQWQLKGKLGYQRANEGGSAWIGWQQHADNFDVQLSGPFGAGTTRIHSNPRFTRLEQSGEQPMTAATATELTEYLFGWPWPVKELSYWVKGVPSPHMPIEHQKTNETQLLSHLEQAGWQLTFSRYKTVTAKKTNHQWTLPGKIQGKLLSDNGSTSFTLVIKTWQPLIEDHEAASVSTTSKNRTLAQVTSADESVVK